jgi:chemotaxis protein methyltransferase WspC
MSASELLRRETGLNLARTVVERAVRQRMRQRSMKEGDDYLRSISPDELKALIELVVVPESWMFRDPGAFAAATRFVRQQLARNPGRTVRILSIPCAGGEEPYSMAMALTDAAIPRHAYTIEGVDLSAAAIARARRGRYTRNAFRGQDLDFRERHFARHGDEYQINEQIRAQVRFSAGNLMSYGAGAGSYDLIFCRNLLIYFDEPTTSAAVAILYQLLANDGLLFAGYAEVPAFCRNRFAPARLPGAFALQKDLGGAAAVPAAMHAPRRARIAAAVAPRPPQVEAAAPNTAAAAPGAASLLARARSQADQGDFQGASANCHAALDISPDSPEAYFILGMVSECEKQPDLADSYWRRCIYLQPDHYEALCHLALLAGQRGDAAAAAAFRQRAARVYQRRQDTALTKDTR